jgi:hypothetical protein
MPTPCRLLERAPDPGQAKPGDMWFCEWLIQDIDKESLLSILSEQYVNEKMAKRAPICVALPGGSQWIVDGLPYEQATDEQGRPVYRAKIGAGWTVSGEATCLTATPSIKTGSYHGYLTHGVLSDDLDGRRY